MKKQLAISFILGAILSAAALYLAFRHVPLAGLGQYLTAIDYLWALPALVLVVASLILRAVRWRYLLAPACPLTTAGAFHPMMIGFMINCVLPGRLGEIARPMALKRTKGVAFGTGFATVVAERFFDLSLLVALFVLILNVVQIDPELTIEFGHYRLNQSLLESIFAKTTVFALVLLLGLALVSVTRTRQVLGAIALAPPRLLDRFTPRLSQAAARYFSRPLVGLLETVATGLRPLRSPRRIAVCTLLTVMVWGLQLLSYVVLSWGCPRIQLSVLEMGATMIMILFFIALPSVPGWWGLWEAGGVFALGLFGVPRLEAAGFTLVNHALQVIPAVVIGIGSAAITGIGIWQVTRAEANSIHAVGATGGCEGREKAL